MGTLFLIRHGQASYGQPDYDQLSSRGQDQARALGRWLGEQKLDRLYSGPLRRQVQTAQIAHESAAGTAVPSPVEVPELAEYPAFEILKRLMPRLIAQDSKFEGLETRPTPLLLDQAFQTIVAKWADDEWQADGMERVSAFVQRVRCGLDRVLAAAPSGARIACVTSAGPIGVAVGLSFGIPEARMVRTSVVIRNASVTELKFRSGLEREDRRSAAGWGPEQVSLVTFNLTAHLPDELHTER